MPGPARVLVVLLTSHLLAGAGSSPAGAQMGPAQTVDPDQFVTVTLEDGNAEAAVEVPQPIADQAVPVTGVSLRPRRRAGKGFQLLRQLKDKAGTLWDTPFIWQPFIEGNFRGGGTVERGELDVFLPLAWSDDSLLFADLRGSLGDTGNHEGNWALAWRRITADDRIVGLWGSYDLRESPTGNHFDQAAFGLEILSVEKEFRINGYVPSDLAPKHLAGGPATAVISGNNLVVRSDGEAAYWGLDAEFGKLLWSNDPWTDKHDAWYADVDAELRAFVGGYYFDNPESTFDQIAGPRVRTELRLYDLAMLGAGSRLTLEGLIQDDQLRGTQAEGGVYIRIPFGARPRRRLDRLQRRMVDRIVRDVDVVAHRQTTDEAAQFVDSGLAVSSARVIDAADDLSASVAAAGTNSLVIVDGSAGAFSEGDTTALSTGQAVLGGGSTLAVVGADTGTQATFSAPGTRPQVTGTDTANDVFQIADDTLLAGLDISGGANGVYGDSVTGITLRDVDVNNAGGGFHILSLNGGTISGNTVNENGGVGFYLGEFNGGMLSGNTANSNDTHGYLVDTFNNGTISDNVASNNGSRGFSISEVNGGTISDNQANSNGLTDLNAGHGFYLETFNNGTLSGNTASGNYEEGFRIETLNNGTISNNTASANGTRGGFYVQTFTGGTISGNASNSNIESGFEVYDFSGGIISNNTATDNNNHGFGFNVLSGGTVSNNTATGNTQGGFVVADTFSGGSMDGNTATGNQDEAFEVTNFSGGSLTDNIASDGNYSGFLVNNISGGTISNNAASGNNHYGFRTSGFSGGTMSGNTATDNAEHGFLLYNVSGGAFTNNTATDNAHDGFEFESVTGGTISDNLASDNGEHGFLFSDFQGGSVHDNTASGNSGSGFVVTTSEVLASAQWSGNSHWYQLVDNGDAVTWHEARDLAAARVFEGQYGHLATFTSDAEWEFARQQIHEPHRTDFNNGWIGATDENSEGSFEWVTGEAFSYNAPATFDNLANEDYVTVWRFGVNDPLQWNDTASNGRSRYLVEYGGDPFTGDALPGFSDNVSTDNTDQGYDIDGAPASGSGTNTGSGNGSADSF